MEIDYTRSKFWTILVALALLGVVLQLVRKRRLKEQYALLWIAMGLVGILLASFRGLLLTLAVAMGIAAPPNAFFLVTLLFLVCILIHFSVVVSSTSDKARALAQELALLRWEKEQAEARLDELGKKVEALGLKTP